MRQIIDISAMREKEVRLIFKSYGLSEKIEKGEIICPNCSHIISWETLGGFIIKKGQLISFCNISECVEAVSRSNSDE